MAKEDGLQETYHVFNSKTFRQSLSIPDATWNKLEPMLKDKITELRNKIRKERAEKASMDKKPEKLPSQYPNMKAKETMLNLVSSIADLGMNDMDDDTDDDMLTTTAFMARTAIALEPPGELGTQQPANGQQSTSVECGVWRYRRSH
jgi:hypothetical protein